MPCAILAQGLFQFTTHPPILITITVIIFALLDPRFAVRLRPRDHPSSGTAPALRKCHLHDSWCSFDLRFCHVFDFLLSRESPDSHGHLTFVARFAFPQSVLNRINAGLADSLMPWLTV